MWAPRGPPLRAPQDAAQRAASAPGHLREAAGAGGLGAGVLGRDRARNAPASRLPPPRAVSSPVPPSPTEGCGGRGGAARTGGSAPAPKTAFGVEIPEELSAASPARCLGRPLHAVLGAGALAPAALASPRPLHKELGGWALGARLALGRGRLLLKAGRGRRRAAARFFKEKNGLFWAQSKPCRNRGVCWLLGIMRLRLRWINPSEVIF